MGLICKYLSTALFLLFLSNSAAFTYQQFNQQDNAWQPINGTVYISLQDIVNAILTSMSTPVLFPKGEKGIKFNIDPELQYKNDQFFDFYMQNSKNNVTNNGTIGIQLLQRALISESNERDIMLIKRDMKFERSKEEHQNIANKLIQIFLDKATKLQIISLAVYLRDRINVELFVYCFSIVLLESPIFSDIEVPNLLETFPESFVDATKFHVLEKQVNNQFMEASKSTPVNVNVTLDETSRYTEPEQKLSYFREDIALNMHNWHWNLIYSPNRRTAKKDRHGELNYYMHQQMLARYNFERLSNEMKLVQRVNLLRPQKVGYFPKLRGDSGGRNWAGRPDGIHLKDVHLVSIRDSVPMKISIMDVIRQTDRILKSIQQQEVLHANGSIISLKNDGGIDIIGKIMNPAPEEINRYYYGNLADNGVNLIAHCHDPDGRYKEAPAVVVASSTAARDPIFYKWLQYLNFIFQQHKSTLPPYTQDQLDFKGIRLESVEVKTEGTRDINTLHTFWDHKNIKLNVDFSMQNKINVSADISRLQHIPFNYTFKVINEMSRPARAMVRIYLLPMYNDQGTKYTLNQQRLVAIEMDRFIVTLGPNERMTFSHGSNVSTVTQPDSYTNDGLGNMMNNCGCGWPSHLLVPMGNTKGMDTKLFAILTDADKDEVVQERQKVRARCESPGYCGLYGQKYPTRRPMGYPFDRPISNTTLYLEDFVQQHTNFAEQNVTIQFRENAYNPEDEPSVEIDEDGIKKKAASIVRALQNEYKLESDDVMGFACWNNRLDVVEALLDTDDNMIDLGTNSQGESCLHLAARKNNVQLAKFLVQRKCDINARDLLGQTSFMKAVLTEKFNVAKYLIDQGAEIYAEDYEGYSVLGLSLKFGFKNAAIFLGDNGVEDYIRIPSATSQLF